jgi:hypothetical protein
MLGLGVGPEPLEQLKLQLEHEHNPIIGNEQNQSRAHLRKYCDVFLPLTTPPFKGQNLARSLTKP